MIVELLVKDLNLTVISKSATIDFMWCIELGRLFLSTGYTHNIEYKARSK